MPGQDRTGPEGRGPKTGRGRGQCGNSVGGHSERGRGQGQGAGRGFGKGTGRGNDENRGQGRNSGRRGNRNPE
ncbi:MAG: DUF5320 domain-containing protein [Thermodesulfobacteriota bacterium]